jgi:hypothetical protein
VGHGRVKSSYAETFSLSKYKKSGTCPDFLCICAANAVLRALPRVLWVYPLTKYFFDKLKEPPAGGSFLDDTRI